MHPGFILAVTAAVTAALLALAGCGPSDPPPDPCVVVTAKVYTSYGMFNEKWDGPNTYKVCVVAVDGKPYRKPKE